MLTIQLETTKEKKMKTRTLTLIMITLFAICFLQSILLSQAQRKVLFEEWTSSTCGPCAANNPILDAFVANHFDTITPVKYHVGWPAPGNDPMYLHNPTQSYDRRYYYNVNAVPTLNVDGSAYLDIWPFNTQSFQDALTNRIGTATPTSVTVTDTRVGDSIRANVVVTNLSNLPSGNYYLRVMVVERKVHYSSPPGTNGETDFFDVFRLAMPNSLGTPISTNAGTYTFNFTYWKNSVWVDSAIYTIAFIQNDNDKSLLNSGKGYHSITAIHEYSNEIPEKYSLEQNYPNPFNPSTRIKFSVPKNGYISLKVYDMLGNEVSTLVDGYHQAGIYDIYFDGSNLSSGVYFYKLTTSGLVQTRKMILVK